MRLRPALIGALTTLSVLLLVLAGGCGEPPAPTTTTSQLPPVVTPTLPTDLPEFGDLDPATGLHVTGTPMEVDVVTYRLTVTGKVTTTLSLSYDDLRRLPTETATPTLECPGEFVDNATWTGVPIHTIIEMAGPLPDAVSLVMTAADGFATTISVAEALEPQNFLAYELEGEPLPALHGFPVRAVFPGKYGSYWVKWLLSIEVR